jgi:tRNA G18 (ribose-2'-O)-methylase SpoU
LGAAFLFTVGRRYRHQATDTVKAPRNVPLYEYADLEEMRDGLPRGCRLVGLEFPHDGAVPLPRLCHPAQAAYLLGGEDCGLSEKALSLCSYVTHIPGRFCLNVAVAGTVAMYDRLAKSFVLPDKARSRTA